MITIRREEAADVAAVRGINLLAFAQGNEGALVDALRGLPGSISLVAVDEGSLVGHIFLSPVEIEGPGAGARTAGLGPMAVLPARQRRGVGSLLVRAGLAECRASGYEAVVLVGHPGYYPRFGFVPASRRGLRFEQPVPDEVFMALELRAGALRGGGGVVRYHPEFSRW